VYNCSNCNIFTLINRENIWNIESPQSPFVCDLHMPELVCGFLTRAIYRQILRNCRRCRSLNRMCKIYALVGLIYASEKNVLNVWWILYWQRFGLHLIVRLCACFLFIVFFVYVHMCVYADFNMNGNLQYGIFRQSIHVLHCCYMWEFWGRTVIDLIKKFLYLENLSKYILYIFEKICRNLDFLFIILFLLFIILFWAGHESVH
jgi:hypothetical protein